MAICIVTHHDMKKLNTLSYENERELEEIVAANPYLLIAEDEPELTLIRKQVNLPGVGIADLIFLDSFGSINVVEVKLGRNAQGRREVVGQIFDYVSTLADYSLVELDALTNGDLDQALRSFADEDDASSYEQLWRTCSTRLRAGKVRVTVVTDAAPDSLVRIMAFLNDHSDLDVRLIAVQKYEGDGEKVFTPQPIVVAREKTTVRQSKGEMSQALADVILAFDKMQPQGLTTVQNARSLIFRQIRIPDWPSSYHYEFLDNGSEITADFHPENRKMGSFLKVLQELEPEVRSVLPHCDITVSPRWKGLGAIRIQFPHDASANDVASGMAKLIEITQPRLDKEIRSRIAASS